MKKWNQEKIIQVRINIYLKNKMKKIVRLTESDLTRIVKRVIKEQENIDFLVKREIYLKNASSKDIRKTLQKRFDPQETIGIFIHNSEFVDFNEFPEICDSNVSIIVLRNTENNLTEVCENVTELSDSTGNPSGQFIFQRG